MFRTHVLLPGARIARPGLRDHALDQDHGTVAAPAAPAGAGGFTGSSQPAWSSPAMCRRPVPATRATTPKAHRCRPSHGTNDTRDPTVLPQQHQMSNGAVPATQPTTPGVQRRGHDPAGPGGRGTRHPCRRHRSQPRPPPTPQPAPFAPAPAHPQHLPEKIRRCNDAQSPRRPGLRDHGPGRDVIAERPHHTPAHARPAAHPPGTSTAPAHPPARPAPARQRTPGHQQPLLAPRQPHIAENATTTHE
jgi:hypothetical protein